MCNLADEIAYNAHDIDDGVRSGLLTMAQLGGVEPFARCRDEALREFPQLSGRRLLFEALRRRLLSCQIHDLIAATRAALAEARPRNVEAVRALPPLVRFSAPMQRQSRELKRFCTATCTATPGRRDDGAGAPGGQRSLCDVFGRRLAVAPGGYRAPKPHRAIADYIAGMTDRFALREHQRLTGQALFG